MESRDTNRLFKKKFEFFMVKSVIGLILPRGKMESLQGRVGNFDETSREKGT